MFQFMDNAFIMATTKKKIERNYKAQVHRNNNFLLDKELHLRGGIPESNSPPLYHF